MRRLIAPSALAALMAAALVAAPAATQTGDEAGR